MTYTDKVKQSKNILKAIRSLKDNETLRVAYGVGWKGEPNGYKINCYKDMQGVTSYSIWSDSSYQGMNVGTMGPTTVKCYTYDMMSQRTNYSFPLYKMSIVKQSK